MCVLITQSCDTKQVNLSGYSNFLYFIWLRISERERERGEDTYIYLSVDILCQVHGEVK